MPGLALGLGFGALGRSPDDEHRIDARDLAIGQLHPLDDGRLDAERRDLGRAEQPVVEVTARRATGPALVAQELAGLHGRALLDDDLAEMRVDAAVAVAIVDDDDDRQRGPEVLLLEAVQIRLEIADPAHEPVVLAARGEDGAGVGGHDPVATERREIDPSWNGSPSTMREPHGDGPNGSVSRPRGSGQR